MALWRRFGGAQPPTYSPRYHIEYAITAPEEHDWLATRLRRSHMLYESRRMDIASVQGLSFPQEAFRSPPGLLRGSRRRLVGEFMSGDLSGNSVGIAIDKRTIPK